MRAERLHHLTIVGNVANAVFYAATGSGIHSDIIPVYAEDLARIDTRVFVIMSLAAAACSVTKLGLESQQGQQPAIDTQQLPQSH